MRLIPHRRDYYDHWAKNRTYSDQAYLYNRKPEVKKIDRMSSCETSTIKFEGKKQYETVEYTLCSFNIWFCGDRIPVIQIKRDSSSIILDDPLIYCYSMDTLPNDLKLYFDKKKKQIGRPTWAYALPTKSSMIKYFDRSTLSVKESSKWLDRCNDSSITMWNGRDHILDMHRKLGAPIFTNIGIISEYSDLEPKLAKERWDRQRRYSYALVNPNLLLLQFGQMMDAFEAFQKLEFFISNELVPPDMINVPPPSDELKVQSKGFNKWSFRKEPGKKKRKEK